MQHVFLRAKGFKKLCAVIGLKRVAQDVREADRCTDLPWDRSGLSQEFEDQWAHQHGVDICYKLPDHK